MTTQVRPYARAAKDGQPPYLHPDYKSTIARAPKRPLFAMPQTLSEVTGPSFDTAWFGPELADMTRIDDKGEAQGQRIILAGRVRFGVGPGDRSSFQDGGDKGVDPVCVSTFGAGTRAAGTLPSGTIWLARVGVGLIGVHPIGGAIGISAHVPCFRRAT